MNKQELLDYLTKNHYIEIIEKFTGQVTVVLNINQGGVTSIEKNIKDRVY